MDNFRLKEIQELNFGYNDAENYKKPENKELFEKFFLKTEEFENFLMVRNILF